MKAYRFLLLGGDSRQAFLQRALLEKGYHADLLYYRTLPAPEDAQTLLQTADVLVFPVPTTQDKSHLFAPTLTEKITLEEITNHITPQTVVFTGGEVPALTACKTRKTVDLLADESMTLKNAMATAEAALSILIRETNITVFNAKILMIGYGRIAQILAEYLNALHGKVTICARKNTARTKAALAGHKTIGFDGLANAAASADMVINTVPAPVLGKRELAAIPKNCLLLDLASKPGGIDFNTAEEYDLNAIHALSLPGKYSAKSAAGFMEESIYNTLV